MLTYYLQRKPCPEQDATFLSQITWRWLDGYVGIIHYYFNIYVCTYGSPSTFMSRCHLIFLSLFPVFPSSSPPLSSSLPLSPPSPPPPSVSCGMAGGSLYSTATSLTSMKKTRQGNWDHASSETGITSSPNLGMITNVCIANCEVYILEFDGSNKPILT